MSELTSLIRTLLEKTELGKVRWQKTEEAHTLRTELEDGTTFALYCDASVAGITTRRADGQTIAGLSVAKLGAFMPNQAVLMELVAAAARSAAGVDRYGEDVIAAVRQL